MVRCNNQHQSSAGINQPADLANHSFPSNHTLRIQIGNVCCAFACRDTEVYGTLQQLYSDSLCDKSVDLYIELQAVDHLSPAEVEAALPETRYSHEDNHFRTTSLVLTGRYDLARGTITITGERSLANPDLEFNFLNRLLSVAYYTACKVRYNSAPPALLVHSCGILRHGKVMMFVGPYDAGKTTIAHLCSEQYGQVVNDEMLLVSRPGQDNDMLMVQGVPILGGFPQRLNTTAPLSCILLLKQGEQTAVRHVNRTEAYLRFMRQVITPAYIGQRDRRAVYSLMADFTDEVIRTTPVYELEFSLDREALWQVLDRLEQSLEKDRCTAWKS